MGNDVASDLRYGTTCLFQASDLLLYFFKNFRSEVLHFQYSRLWPRSQKDPVFQDESPTQSE